MSIARAAGSSNIKQLLRWGNNFGRASAIGFHGFLSGSTDNTACTTDLLTYTVDGVVSVSSADF